MKKMFSLAIAACLAIAPILSQAQDSTKNRKMEMRKAMKNKWQNATPEEKEKMKGRAKMMKAKYDSLPPEKQQAMKEKIKAARKP